MNDPHPISLAPDVMPTIRSSLLGGALALGGLPLGLALFFSTQPQEYAMRFEDGGPAMYLIVDVAALASLVGAVGALLALRRGFAVWTVGAFIALGMSGLATLAYQRDVTNTFMAMAHASPLDRATIMSGGTGESTQLLVLAAALVSGLLILQGLAMLVGCIAAREANLKKALLTLGLGLVGIGAWQGLTARGLAGERDALQALAHADPVERLTVAIDGFERMALNRHLSLVPLLAALVCAAAGATRLRAHRRWVLAGILVPIVSLAGAAAAVRMDPEVREVLAMPRIEPELLVLDGPVVELRSTSTLLTVGKELVDGLGRPASLESLKGKEVDLGLEPEVTMESLRKAFRQLRAASVSSLTLVGKKKTAPPLSVPDEWTMFFDETRGLPLALWSQGDCRNDCQTATLGEKSLDWGNESWPRRTSSIMPNGYAERRVPLLAEGLTLESFLSACHTADSNAARIALVLPE